VGKVLVVGGAGYIGSHCSKALARSGREVLVFDDLSTGHKDLCQWGDLVQGDVCDKAAVDQLFSEHKISAVFHFAAKSLVGESGQKPDLYWRTNLGGTMNLLDAMAQHSVPHIIFSSTAAVYGEPDVELIDENQSIQPINTYGRTKVACEAMIRSYAEAHSLGFVCPRYFNAAGADPELETGEDHSPETHVIPILLDAARGIRDQFSIFGEDYQTDDGSAVRDYIHVTDLASAHVAALDYLLADGDSTALNLGTSKGASVKELLQAAIRTTNREIPTAIAPRRSGDPARLVADATRAQKLLKWTPTNSSLEQIIDDAWRWHLKRF
jgi:UDP-glucose-4-epimerase GalE